MLQLKQTVSHGVMIQSGPQRQDCCLLTYTVYCIKSLITDLLLIFPSATDINAAVLKGVEMITKYPRKGSASILILLTDGDPTSG